MKNSEVKDGRLPVFKERFDILRSDMSNTEFAEFLGMSRQTVGFYLNGDRIPDALVLRQIAEKCHVSADWLLGLSDFFNENERNDAEKIYDDLMSLMAIEFDENDKKRVYRSLSAIMAGFKDALCEYSSYTWYENAAINTGLALSAVAGCMKIAMKKSNAQYEERDKLFKDLDKIMSDASITAYKELGYFFKAYRDAIMEALGAHDHREYNVSFARRLNELNASIEKGSEESQ